MRIVTNADGIKGGSRLWLSDAESKITKATPTK